MKTIKLLKWKPGLPVITLIDIVRSINGPGLLAAKREVESFLDGNSIALHVGDVDTATIEQQLMAINVEYEVLAE